MKHPYRHDGERRKRKCSRQLIRDFPTTPEVVEEKVFPRNSQRAHTEENTTLHLVERPCWSSWICPEGSCSPWRSHVGANFWQELQSMEQSPHTAFLAQSATCGGPVLQQAILGGLYHIEKTLFLIRNKLIFPKSTYFAHENNC